MRGRMGARGGRKDSETWCQEIISGAPEPRVVPIIRLEWLEGVKAQSGKGGQFSIQARRERANLMSWAMTSTLVISLFMELCKILPFAIGEISKSFVHGFPQGGLYVMRKSWGWRGPSRLVALAKILPAPEPQQQSRMASVTVAGSITPLSRGHYARRLLFRRPCPPGVAALDQFTRPCPLTCQKGFANGAGVR
jgi:hypothetical protein